MEATDLFMGSDRTMPVAARLFLLVMATAACGCQTTDRLAPTNQGNPPRDLAGRRGAVPHSVAGKNREPALTPARASTSDGSAPIARAPTETLAQYRIRRFPRRAGSIDRDVKPESKHVQSRVEKNASLNGAKLASAKTAGAIRRTVGQRLALPPEPGKSNVPADDGSARSIDLSTSLTLVAGQNPQVAFVQERVREASAELQAAEALWLPSIRAGANYNKHEGSFQDVAGTAFGVSRGSLYTGFGARAVGASSPAVPGLAAQFHLADAIFQPIIAERTLTARQHAVTAVTNDQLLRAALAHLELLKAVGQHRIAHDTRVELEKLAKLTASFANRGQGTQADADRAQTELRLQTNAVTRAEASIKSAAARLAEVLSLDGAMSLRPAEEVIVRVELVSAEFGLESLVASAMEQRPELSENLLQQSAAVQSYRRERYSPLLPHVGAGVSWGGFGGGVGDTITHYKDRLDVDLWAYWEVRNLGFGERAARNAAHSRVHQTQHGYTRLMNRIRREVTESLAELQSATAQLEQAKAATTSAEASLKRNFQRIRQGQGLPLEVLQSIRALNAARQETLNAYAAYNGSQFRLHHALGWPENPLGSSGE